MGPSIRPFVLSPVLPDGFKLNMFADLSWVSFGYRGQALIYVKLSRGHDQVKNCTCRVNDMKYGFN